MSRQAMSRFFLQETPQFRGIVNIRCRVRKCRALAVIAALSGGGCAVVDVNVPCYYSREQPLYESSPETLFLYIGAPSTFLRETPYIVLNRRSDGETVSTVNLQLQDQPLSWPTGLDFSRCVGSEWNSYALLVDLKEWNAYWTSTKESGFSYVIAFPEFEDPVNVKAKSLGFAFVNSDQNIAVASCGCFWK